MRELTAQVNNISSREDFIKFLSALLADLQADRSAWENNTLDKYLGGIKSWTEDMNGYYVNMGKPTPENVNWRVFAEILMAATIYE
ncbi:DUF7660 family protein [Spirosoma linguale]|uniref:DUF7660 domain-containing protein n=1 Tax=Spirosoma linguale (strain ATCC 33905 / DSM 74 / LMG 10896 / Claus 1) TaxID=504472 RepID=D2QI40_SPILD|nr:conserved hypothetical protein [Spirosoma linguale DSM 74]